MKYYVMACLIDGVICGLGYMVYWYVASRMGFNPRKPKVLIFGFLAVFCMLRFETFISHKFDFRGKWDAYQFRKTMIEPEAFDKPIEPISEPLPIEESVAENEEVCCGGSEEEREAFEAQVIEAWNHPKQADPALVELLPSPDIAEQAEAFLSSEDHFDQIDEIDHSDHSDHSDEGDLPLAPRDEPEIDWDQTRLEMLAGAEASHGKIGKALLAETMLEADHFMENMSEADAREIAKRARDMWEKQAHRIPEPLISGTNAAIWRKTFEMLAAIERSEINEEMRKFDEEEARWNREFLEKMEAKGHSSISEEEYMRDYLGMSEEAISETMKLRQERVLHNSNDATFGN